MNVQKLSTELGLQVRRSRYEWQPATKYNRLSGAKEKRHSEVIIIISIIINN